MSKKNKISGEQSFKDFEREERKHQVLISKLRLALKSERSILAKFLIQQNLIHHQLDELIQLASSVIMHSLLGVMDVFGQKYSNEILFSNYRSANKTTLGDLILIFEKISSSDDIKLVISLKNYNKHRNNLIHNLALNGKYNNVEEIKSEAKATLKIGSELISSLKNRYDELHVDLIKITYHIFDRFKDRKRP